MRRIKGRLINKIRLTDKVYELTFELIAPPKISFSAGQFLCLYLEKDLKRVYSIVNPPIVSDRIILLVDISPMGPASKYFLKLKEEEVVNFQGPLGEFKLNPSEADNFVFVTTGTGIAPICSMIDSLKTLKGKSARLYFGLRFIKDIFYFDKFYRLENSWPEFSFFPVLSRPEDGWCGRVGRVTDWLRKDSFLKDKTSFYICGNLPMTEETKEILKEKGILKEKIYSEAYGF